MNTARKLNSDSAPEPKPRQAKMRLVGQPTLAQQLFYFASHAAESAEKWEDVHNAIYGVGGKFAELFPEQSDRVAFTKTPEFAKISELIGSIGKNKKQSDMPDVVSGKFVLRLPESMHAALVAEAKREGVSLNQLCIAKLAAQLRSIVQ